MADETATATTAATAHPYILACGYEQVWIEKSGNSFPAWKISLQTGAWWRSKLDFLLLSRQSSVPLPKAALQKLAQQSPWQRPNCTMEQHTINHWKPQMKKSLLLLDRFLVTVQKNHPQAWSQFCRPCDTENLLVCSNDESGRINKNQSKQWGQYFCSNENAKQLVRVFMEMLRDNSDWVVVEPSCGHGTILEAFAQERTLQEATYKLVGIDIDSNAISYCRENHSLNPSSVVKWVVADFLQWKKCDFGIDGSESCAVIGNPPFHLAQEFVQHAILEYKARVIVFIMPRRLCGKDTFDYGQDYECRHIEMESCDFYFQGDPSQRIKQPASIQCLWKRK